MSRSSETKVYDADSTPLASRAASSVQHATDTVSSTLRSTEEKIRAAAAESSRRLAETQDAAKEQVQKSMKYIRTTTRKNPLLVAGVALAVGALVALLFKRD